VTTAGAAGLPRIVVTAAVIERDGCYLVTRRITGTHLAGFWEFPGGKCDDGEPLEACLARELVEELAVGARVGDEMYSVAHAYPDRVVELHFFRCVLEGEPTAVLGQEVRWVPRSDLHALEFPPADAELITMLSADPSTRSGPSGSQN
jgi:mutator protein MutT